MEVSKSKKTDTIEILNSLTNLRNSSLEEEEFWFEYLESISLLTKSNLSFIVKKDEELTLFQEYDDASIDDISKDSIYNNISSLVQRSSQNTYAYEKSNFQNRHIVAIKIDSIEEESEFFLCFLIENNNKNEFTNVILRAILCKDVPFAYFNNKNKSKAVEVYQSNDMNDIDEQEENDLTSVVELINYIVSENKFKLSIMKLVDELCTRYKANRVSIGWEFNQYVTPKAISHVEDFLKSSYSSKALEAIYEEAYEQDSEIFYPEDKNSDLITNAHEIYLKDNKLSNLYTFPIRLEDEIIGVISLEFKESELSFSSLETIRLALNLIAPILNNIYTHDQNIFKKSLVKTEKMSKNFFGPQKSLLKLSTILVSILFLWIIFGKLEYKVESVTNLQTDNISYVSAPFDGIVQEVFVDSGDDVEKGKKLLAFDDKEMILKKLEINADLIRYDTEAEKARSQRKLADMQIALAKKEQSEANLKKLNYFLEKAELKSPFDGIIIEGDKEKLLGSPFSKGDILIQIAKPTDLYAKLKVQEEYIDEIKVGQIAELNLLSRPHEYFNVKVEKIIPMANVDDENGNVFTIKVVFLDEVKPWMRPGMSGIAKIKIEQRPVYWILTHKISDFLHMHVWW